MTIDILPMTPSDYDEVVTLWRATEHLGRDEVSDSREGIERYLARNPGMSFVAREAGRLVGAVLCGHDGRRGYLYRLAVAAGVRRAGVGRALVEHGLAALAGAGVRKCTILVFAGNETGLAFWKRLGWEHHPDVAFLTRPIH